MSGQVLQAGKAITEVYHTLQGTREGWYSCLSIEQQQVHIFFVGLDGDFEQVQGEILCKDPVPDLQECLALVQREAL